VAQPLLIASLFLAPYYFLALPIFPAWCVMGDLLPFVILLSRPSIGIAVGSYGQKFGFKPNLPITMEGDYAFFYNYAQTLSAIILPEIFCPTHFCSE